MKPPTSPPSSAVEHNVVCVDTTVVMYLMLCSFVQVFQHFGITEVN